MVLATENEPSPVMTQEQRDALATRIAAVLCQRKNIGEERRKQFRKYSDRRFKEIDRMYDTIMSSNAAV